MSLCLRLCMWSNRIFAIICITSVFPQTACNFFSRLASVRANFRLFASIVECLAIGGALNFREAVRGILFQIFFVTFFMSGVKCLVVGCEARRRYLHLDSSTPCPSHTYELSR